MRSTPLLWILVAAMGIGTLAADLSEDLRGQVDAVVRVAYESAMLKLPCKLKADGKTGMLIWKDVDKCLNTAYTSVDWQTVSAHLREIQEKAGMESAAFLSIVEASLEAHAVEYDRVFKVKNDRPLLPLTNSVLKFLPAGSLLSLPVIDKTGARVGSFAGVYTFEKTGTLSGTAQRHSLFQYTDANGKIQSSSDRLLLDSFGVSWKEACRQRGFRLPSDRIVLRGPAGRREPINPKVPRKLS